MAALTRRNWLRLGDMHSLDTVSEGAVLPRFSGASGFAGWRSLPLAVAVATLSAMFGCNPATNPTPPSATAAAPDGEATDSLALMGDQDRMNGNDDDRAAAPREEMKQQYEEFLRRLDQSEVHDIVGVVSAFGVSGGGSSGKDWHLVLFFARWRLDGSPIRTDELRVEMPVSEEELSAYRARIKAYDILHARGRLAEYPERGMQTRLDEIVSDRANDAELEAQAKELQKPVVYEDPRLGRLMLDRSINVFRGEPLWRGARVELFLSMDGCDSISQPLAVAAALWDSQNEWHAKALQQAQESLFSLKNDVWLQEGEAKISEQEFRDCMTLDTISVSADGTVEFWFDDGDLFWGHSIEVSGSLDDGFDEANLAG